MAETKIRAKEMQSLLRGEISAVETYDMALDKVEDEPGAQELRRIQADHQEAVSVLRQRVALEGETPDDGSGAWGAFAKTVQGTANVFGNHAALKALKEGEEHGLKEYRSALSNDDTPPDLSRVIESELLPRQERHIRTLDALMEQR
jgi:uncharacterized protein (TIGR02284 family)